jgi:hypothetical protein
VIGYGLSERVLPGVIDLADSRAALGRLDQPLTYWNAMGALAAMALVLLARIAADAARPRALRVAAGASAAPMGAGCCWRSRAGRSRPRRSGWSAWCCSRRAGRSCARAAGVAGLAVAGGALAALLPAVRTMEGARERQGLILLAGLALLAAAGAWAAARAPAAPTAPARGLPLRPAVVAAVAGAVALALVAGSAAVETGSPRDGATTARLSSTESNRYAYWRVALDGFAGAPLRGDGAGSFGALWLRDRTVPRWSATPTRSGSRRRPSSASSACCCSPRCRRGRVVRRARATAGARAGRRPRRRSPPGSPTARSTGTGSFRAGRRSPRSCWRDC